MVHAGVEILFDQFNQAGGNQVVIIHRVRVIADGGWIAHDDKDIAHIECVRGQQVALNAQQVAAAGGEVQNGFDICFALDETAYRPGAHAHARHRAVSNVDHIRARVCQQGWRQPAVSWVDKPRGGSISTAIRNFPLRQFPGHLQLAVTAIVHILLLRRDISPRFPLISDVVGFIQASRMAADMRRGCAAASADHIRASLPEGKGVIAKIFRGGGIKDAPA